MEPAEATSQPLPQEAVAALVPNLYVVAMLHEWRTCPCVSFCAPPSSAGVGWRQLWGECWWFEVDRTSICHSSLRINILQFVMMAVVAQSCRSYGHVLAGRAMYRPLLLREMWRIAMPWGWHFEWSCSAEAIDKTPNDFEDIHFTLKQTGAVQPRPHRQGNICGKSLV